MVTAAAGGTARKNAEGGGRQLDTVAQNQGFGSADSLLAVAERVELDRYR